MVSSSFRVSAVSLFTSVRQDAVPRIRIAKNFHNSEPPQEYRTHVYLFDSNSAHGFSVLEAFDIIEAKNSMDVHTYILNE